MSPLPPKMHVTGDCVLFRYCRGSGLEVLLVRRANPPYKGQWAVPGGFVELEEDVPDAALRELKEETGAVPRLLHLLGVWGKPGRDPRGRVITAAYLAVVGPEDQQVRGGDDAAEAAWHPLHSLPPLAFDHDQIVEAARQRLKELCERTHLAFAFLSERFTLRELKDVLCAVGCAAMCESGLGRMIATAQVVQDVQNEDETTFRCVVDDFLKPLGGSPCESAD